MGIDVIINGAYGRMGQVTINAINQASDLTLVAKLGREDNLDAAIKAHSAKVVIDFTTANAVYQNIITILKAGARPVIGTSGLLAFQIASLKKLCQERKLGAIIAPNFSIGAVLMMKFAADTAKYLPNVEILEMHHSGKEDSPSGTAIKTADMISESRTSSPHSLPKPKETIPGARGANYHDIPIHAIRLPGLVAHQQVFFGGEGETLAICHNSIDRQCFMPGVLLACRKVVKLNKLVYGLEHLLA